MGHMIYGTGDHTRIFNIEDVALETIEALLVEAYSTRDRFRIKATNADGSRIVLFVSDGTPLQIVHTGGDDVDPDPEMFKQLKQFLDDHGVVYLGVGSSASTIDAGML